MNIDDLTLGEAKALANLFRATKGHVDFDNGMIGKYVIVRCHDAGVHCGVLVSHNGRECVLSDSRRLWAWVPADGAKWLSGLAVHGITPKDSRHTSRVSVPVDRIHLTENCEIILCTAKSEDSLRRISADV